MAASDVGGEVKYIIDADDKKFIVKIEEASKNFNKFVNTISDSSTKVSKALDKGFTEGTSSAIKSLNKLTDTAVNGFATISKSIASISFNTLTTAAGTASAALTTLITGGIADTQFLENTQIQMQGLTHSIEDGNKAMAYATQYFKNNPFNRFDVTSATKALIQFGTEVDDVPAMLDKMGKVSLSTGVNISELATLYAKSSADGRVGLMDIQMLAERGVPIWDAFAKATGKSSAQIREETAKGGVAVADFQKAFDYLVDDNAMEQFNNTFSRQVDRFKGRLSNMKGAIAGYTMDVNEGFTASANGLYKAVTNLTKAFADAMDSEPGKKLLSALTKLGEALAPIIDKLATLIPPAIEKAADALDYIAEHTETLIPILGGALVLFGRLGANLPGIGGIIGSLGGNFKSIIKILNPLQGGVFGAVKAFSALSVVLGLIGLVKNGSVPELFEVLKKVFSQVQAVLKSLLPVFIRTAETLGGALLKSLEAILPTIPPIVNAIGKLAVAFGNAVAAVAPTVFRVLAVALQAVAAAINAIPQPILNALVTALVSFAVLAKTASIVNNFKNKLVSLIGTVKDLYKDTQNAVGIITSNFDKLVEAMQPALSKLQDFGDAVSKAFNKVGEFGKAVGTAVAGGFQIVGSAAKTAGTYVLAFFQSIGSAFKGIGSVIATGAGSVVRVLGTIGSTIVGVFKESFGLVLNIAKNFGSMLFSVFDWVTTPIQKLFKFMFDGIVNFATTAAKLVQKGWENLTSFFKWVADGVKDLLIKGFTIAKDFAVKAAGLIQKGWENLTSFFAKIADGIKDLMVKAFTTIQNIAIGAKDLIVKGFNIAKDAVVDFATRAIKVLTDVKNAIFKGAGIISAKVKEIVGSVVSVVGNIASSVAEVMGKIGSAIADGFGKAIDLAKTFASKVGSAIGDFANGVATYAKAAFDVVADKVSFFVTYAKDQLSRFGSWVADLATKAGQKLTDFFAPATNAVKKFVSETTTAIKNWATNIFVKYIQPLGDKIGNIFNGAKNKITSSLSGISQSFKDHFGKAKQSAQETGTVVEQVSNKTSTAFSKIFGKAKTDADGATTSIKNVATATTESATGLAKAGDAGKKASEGLKSTKEGADAAKEGMTSISDGVKGLFDVLNNTVQGIMNVLNTLATGITTVLQTTLGGIGQAIKALLEPLSDSSLLTGVGVLAGVAATLVIAAVALQLIANIDIGWGALLNNLAQMAVAVLAFGVLAAAVGALMDTGIGAALLASGLAAIAGVAATIMVTALAMKVAADSMPNNMGDVAKRIGEGLKAVLEIDFGGFLKNMGKMGAAAAAAATTAMVASIAKSLKEITELNLPSGEEITKQITKITDAYDIIKDKFLDDGGGFLGGLKKFFVGGENDSNETVQLAAKTTEYIKNLAEGLKAIGKIELPDKNRITSKLENIYGCFEIIRDKFLNRSDGVLNQLWNWVAGKENNDSDMIKLVSEVTEYIKTIATNVSELGKIELPSKDTMTPIFEAIEGYATTIKEKFIDDKNGVWQAIGEWFGGKKDADTSQIETIKNVSATLKEIATNVKEIAGLELNQEGVNKTLTTLETIMGNIKEKFANTDSYDMSEDVKTALETVKNVASALGEIGKTFSTIPEMDPGKAVAFVTNVSTVVDKIAKTFTGEGKTVDITELDTDMSGYASNAASIAENLVNIGKSFTELPVIDESKTIEYLNKVSRIISAIVVMFVDGAENPFGFTDLKTLGIDKLSDTLTKVDTSIKSVASVVGNLKTITEAVAEVKLPEEQKITDFLTRTNKIISGINTTFLGTDEEGEGIKLEPSKWGTEGSIVKGIANIVNVINNIKLIAEAVANTNTNADVTKFNTFVSLLGTMFDNIAKSLEGKMDAMFKIGVDYGTKLAEGLKTKEQDIYKQGLEFQGKVWNGINEKIEDIYNLGKTFGDKFKKGLDEKHQTIKDTGAYLAQGLIDGMNSKLESVKSTARNLADQANKAFQEKLDIRSPSRVFRANGEYVGLGLIKGMQDQYKEVADTARGLAEAVMEPFDDINDFSVNIAGQVSRDGEGGGYGNSQKTYNITQNNNINNGPSYSKMLADLKWEMFKS